MSVTLGDARRIAELARLRLDDMELRRLTGELNRILDHVVALEALGEEEAADVVEPTEDLVSLRPSEAEAPDPLVHDPARAAPDWREGFFVVPALPGLSDPSPREEE